MVLFGFIGELGCGKTLSQTFMLWKNWLFRRKKIYANYHLFKIPYILITDVKHFQECREGFIGADEIWRICDSRLTRTSANRFVADILGRSRKRHLNYCFTSQLLDSLDKRIRKIMDFTAYPILNASERLCKVNIFRTGYPKEASYMKTYYFKTPMVFEMFDTDEEIDLNEEEAPEPMKIIFQESKDSEPMYFDTWEEADKTAERWWIKNKKIIEEII
jgi:hypothetical protein